MMSKAEKYGVESVFWIKKKLWLDPTLVSDDVIEARLEMLQLHEEILAGANTQRVFLHLAY